MPGRTGSRRRLLHHEPGSPSEHILNEVPSWFLRPGAARRRKIDSTSCAFKSGSPRQTQPVPASIPFQGSRDFPAAFNIPQKSTGTGKSPSPFPDGKNAGEKQRCLRITHTPPNGNGRGNSPPASVAPTCARGFRLNFGAPALERQKSGTSPHNTANSFRHQKQGAARILLVVAKTRPWSPVG